MARVRGVVLAAGRGVRMGGGTPKTLLPIRGDRPMLHFVLRALTEAGIQDLLVVTGHRPNEIQEFVGENWSGEAQFVWNPRYASWGNFHSLRIGLDQSPGSTIVAMNSDIIVTPQVVKDALAANGDLVLAVQSRRNLEQEDMRVRLDGQRVMTLGKDVPLRLSQGEFVGVSVLRPSAVRAYQEISTDLEWAARTDLYYEDVYRMMIERGTAARATPVEIGAYAEVDSPEDQQAAGEVINRHFSEASTEAAGAG